MPSWVLASFWGMGRFWALGVASDFGCAWPSKLCMNRRSREKFSRPTNSRCPPPPFGFRRQKEREEIKTMKTKIQFAMIPAAMLLASSVAQAEMTLTQNDVNQMKYKVDMAAKFFQATWRDAFSHSGKS